MDELADEKESKMKGAFAFSVNGDVSIKEDKKEIKYSRYRRSEKICVSQCHKRVALRDYGLPSALNICRSGHVEDHTPIYWISAEGACHFLSQMIRSCLPRDLRRWNRRESLGQEVVCGEENAE